MDVEKGEEGLRQREEMAVEVERAVQEARDAVRLSREAIIRAGGRGSLTWTGRPTGQLSEAEILQRIKAEALGEAVPRAGNQGREKAPSSEELLARLKLREAIP